MKIAIVGCMAVYAAATSAAVAPPDPKVVQIAHDMMKAMGGETAWKQARYVKFDFIVKIHGKPSIARSHLWDRQTGRYRLEDKAGNDAPAVMLFNVRDKLGVAYVSGKRLEGADAGKALKGAYRTYRTDIDWLTLPWNLLSAGVHSKYGGEKTLNGQIYDTVNVTVDEPAGTEAMHYAAYISRKTHLLEHWTVGSSPNMWDWQYAPVNNLQLASNHLNDEKKVEISMGLVKVLDHLDSAYLTDPDKKLAKLK